MSRKIILHMLAYATLCLAACSVQLHSGEELPDEEASILTFRRTAPEVTIQSISIDGKNVPSYATSVSLIPGQHLVSMRYRIELRDSCDVRDYMCPSTVLQGRCEGFIETEMGSRNALVIDARSGEVRAQIQAHQMIAPLATTDGTPEGDIPCSKPSRFDEVGRAGLS